MRGNHGFVVLGLAYQAAAWVKSTREDSWRPARETSPVELENNVLGWSPKPTAAADLAFGAIDLRKRVDGYTLSSGTCAFISSDGNSLTCLTAGAGCSYTEDFIGCCDPTHGCGVIKTTCIDYAASSAGQCNLPKDFHTLCCNDPLTPACYTWVMSTDGPAGPTATFLDCASASGTGVLLDYDPAFVATHSLGSSSTSSSSSAASSSSSIAPKPGKHHSKTPIGAIVGGAVGGVAALGLVGIALFFFLRKKPDNSVNNGQAANTTGQPPMGQNPNTQSPGVSYTSGVPSGYQGFSPPQEQHPGFQQQYPLQGQYPPPGWQGQWPPQQWGAGGFSPTSPTSSPPPHSSPSPIKTEDVVSVSTLTHSSPPPATELADNAPVGHENNRAELGGH